MKGSDVMENQKLQKIESIQHELRAMYDDGDFGELLRSGVSQEQVEFLIKLKDYFRGQDQKAIIHEKFVI